MDIHCPRCGEPWDLDTLHEETRTRMARADAADDGDHQALSAPLRSDPDGPAIPQTYAAWFDQVRKDFYRQGCPALTSYEAACTPTTAGGDRAAASVLLMSLLGDDIDALASMSEDLDRL
jgi:hypothetical protein